MIELNQTEWNVYHALLGRAAEPQPPTLLELGRMCGFRSGSHVSKTINTLVDCGLVQRGSFGTTRTYRAVRAPVALRPGIRKRPRSVTGARGAEVTP